MSEPDSSDPAATKKTEASASECEPKPDDSIDKDNSTETEKEEEEEPALEDLSPEEQLARYEESLKNDDWGHQPC